MMACILLTSCNKPIENEIEAVLKVAVHSEEYKKAIDQLYHEYYPETQLEIEVVSEKDIESKILNQKEIEYDVYWVEDAYIPLVIDHLLELKEECEIPLNNNFNNTFNLVKKAYQPIMGTAEVYYALDLNKIEKEQLSEDIFLSIEKMSAYKNCFYYLDYSLFTSSFLTSNLNYFPGNEKSTINFTGESFYEALVNYQQVFKMIPCDDPKSYDNWFINNSYYSGFITSNMQLDEDEEMNGGKYKITKLPTIDDKQLYTQAISYGYVINKNTKYPNAAKNLIQLMHTKEGIQVLCNSNELIPFIPTDMLDEFEFENVHIKEKAYALNYSISRSWVSLQSRNEAAIQYLYLDETMNKMKACDLETCQNELDKGYQEWLK